MCTLRTLVPVLVVCSLAAGCATNRTQPAAPQVELPQQFRSAVESGSASQAPHAARWWEAMDDSGLNQLIERALEGNLIVQAAPDEIRRKFFDVDVGIAATRFPARAEMGQALVDRDAFDPEPERRVAAIRVNTAYDLDERVLEHILGETLAAQHPPRQRVGRRRIDLVEPGVRASVATLGRGQQGSIDNRQRLRHLHLA